MSLLTIVSTSISKEIAIKNFGAIPNDGVDDAPAIRMALKEAKARNATEISFESGVYDINSIVEYRNSGKFHAALFDKSKILLVGTVDSEGIPTTTLLKHNPQFTDGRALHSIFWFERCKDITFKNFCIDNYPKTTTSARVTKVGDDFIEVDVLSGMPYYDNMPVYCANAWDLESKTLKHVPSLTYGNSPANWKLLDAASGKMRLDSINFCQYLDVGDGISWHTSAHGVRQLHFEKCEDVKVENVIIYNGDGFLMATHRCKNVYGYKVITKANNMNQLAVGPRDAWKMAWCDGEVIVENCTFEGVRWDGQNVHGTFLFVSDILDDTNFVAYKIGGNIASLKSQPIGIWKGRDQTKFTTKNIDKMSYDRDNRKTYFRIEVDRKLGDNIVPGSLITLYGYDIDNYILRNVRMKNIAGTGSVIKNENVLIENCTYENIMYPAINIGTEYSLGNWIEGTFPRDVTIRNCRFIDCGWQKKLGVMGAIGIGNGWDYPHMGWMQDIKILNNYFEKCVFGVEVEDAKNVIIEGNRFKNVCKNINIDTLYSKNVVERDNMTFGENDK